MSVQGLIFPLEEPLRLRPVEVFPVEHQGERFVMLRDPADPDVEPVVVSNGVVELLTLLDGTHGLEAVESILRLRGQELPGGQVQNLLEQLDQAGYLEGPRARERLRQRRTAFAEKPLRLATHAGGAYPGDAVELPSYLAEGYLHADGPGTLPTTRDSTVAPPRAIVAPHVDLHRGAPTYSWAYKALAESQPADLYVVLGTCHTPVEGSFAATAKSYDTPLGTVPGDPAFLERVARLWGRDLFEGEFSHSAEHSIEFQAVYLRSLGLAGEDAAPMVGILCDSLHSLVLPPHSPRDVAIVADLVDALREAVREDGRRVTFIAAVDLAHIGPRFGDRWVVDAERLAWAEKGDHETLRRIAEGDAEGYFRHVVEDGDARRICGFTPLYLLTELMGTQQARGDLLRYTQWVAPDGSSSVTFASMVFR